MKENKIEKNKLAENANEDVFKKAWRGLRAQAFKGGYMDKGKWVRSEAEEILEQYLDGE